MYLSPAIIFRALYRVGLSSISEITGRTVNLILPFVILALHSVSLATDTFFLILAIALFVQGSLANALVSVQVPDLIQDTDQRSLRTFLPWVMIAGLFAGGATLWLTPAQLGITATFTTTLSIMIAASAGLLAAPAVAVLNAAHRYVAPGLTWGFRIPPLIAYALWSPDIPALHWLLAGIALADTFRATTLLVLARSRLSLYRHFQPLRFPTDALYLLAGNAIAGFTPLAARWLASLLDTGAVSVFETADRIYAAIASLATIGISSVVLVYLSRLSGTEDEHRAWRWILLFGGSWSFCWLIIAAMIWAAFPFLSQIFYQQTGETLAQMRQTFLALSVGLPGFIMAMVLSRRLIALGLVKQLLPIAVLGLTISIVAGWLLSILLGTSGLALGIVAGQYAALLLMTYVLLTGHRHAYLDTR